MCSLCDINAGPFVFDLPIFPLFGLLCCCLIWLTYGWPWTAGHVCGCLFFCGAIQMFLFHLPSLTRLCYANSGVLKTMSYSNTNIIHSLPWSEILGLCILLSLSLLIIYIFWSNGWLIRAVWILESRSSLFIQPYYEPLWESLNSSIHTKLGIYRVKRIVPGIFLGLKMGTR
jgi:hypothetical protein